MSVQAILRGVVAVTWFGAVLLHAAEDANWLTNPGFEEAADGQPAGWFLGMEGRGEARRSGSRAKHTRGIVACGSG